MAGSARANTCAVSVNRPPSGEALATLPSLLPPWQAALPPSPPPLHCTTPCSLRSLRGSALLSQWGGRPARSDVLASAVAQLPILPLSMVPLPQAAQASYLLSMPYNVHLEAGAAAGAGGYVLLPLTALGASG